MMNHPERYEELISDMWDELMGAKKYAEDALSGQNDRSYSDSMYEMARQEYNHFTNLHQHALALANSWPEGDKMHFIWECDQKRLMKHAAEVKRVIEMYRG